MSLPWVKSNISCSEREERMHSVQQCEIHQQQVDLSLTQARVFTALYGSDPGQSRLNGSLQTALNQSLGWLEYMEWDLCIARETFTFVGKTFFQVKHFPAVEKHLSFQ